MLTSNFCKANISRTIRLTQSDCEFGTTNFDANILCPIRKALSILSSQLKVHFLTQKVCFYSVQLLYIQEWVISRQYKTTRSQRFNFEALLGSTQRQIDWIYRIQMDDWVQLKNKRIKSIRLRTMHTEPIAY